MLISANRMSSLLSVPGDPQPIGDARAARSLRAKIRVLGRDRTCDLGFEVRGQHCDRAAGVCYHPALVWMCVEFGGRQTTRGAGPK